MSDIRKRLRMLADNAQRSEIVEDAIRLIDRLEGRVNMDLPIKVLSRDDVQIYRLLTKRSTLEEILCMMDEFQEPALDPNRCAVCGWPLKERIEDGCVRGNCSQRPRPAHLYDECRARAESVMYAKEPRESGVSLISAERQRQVAEEGWNSSHDDEHGNYELVSAACCYAKQAYLGDINPTTIKVPMGWPWDEKWWKPSSRIRMLVKAGALIAAEIDRVIRQEAREAKEPKKWEPGMVLKGTGIGLLVRLDVDEGDDMWTVTHLDDGARLEHQGLERSGWKVHRLKDEFKVGDWVQRASDPPFKAARIGMMSPASTYWVFSDDTPRRQELNTALIHVPPPKESTLKQALGDLARQEQAEGKYRCDLPNEKEVMPNATRSDNVHVHGMPDRENAVTGDSPSGSKTSERFSGPHWFSEANRTRCESTRGFNHQLSAWSTSDWFMAVLGELGEAANNAKKLNRVRDGIPGNDEHTEELKKMLRKELGDVFVYLDLLCQSLGFYALDAAVEVFDEKSKKIGYPCDLRDAWLEKEGKG